MVIARRSAGPGPSRFYSLEARLSRMNSPAPVVVVEPAAWCEGGASSGRSGSPPPTHTGIRWAWASRSCKAPRACED